MRRFLPVQRGGNLGFPFLGQTLRNADRTRRRKRRSGADHRRLGTDRPQRQQRLGPNNQHLLHARPCARKRGNRLLRYDKQGIGGSRYQDPELYKQEDRLRLADYIADAEALTDYLKERGFRKIILAGHSEGSLVALVAATESPDVAAVISLAGAGYPIDEILQFQLTRELISYNPGLILNVQSILSRLKQGKRPKIFPQFYKVSSDLPYSLT